MSQNRLTRLANCEIKNMRPIFKTEMLVYQSKANLGPVHTGTQSFRSIFVPVSGTQQETVHTGTERLRIGFCFCSHGNAIVPFHSFLFGPCHFFQKKTISTHALRAKILSFRCLDQSCTSLPVHTGTERNDCVSFHFSYHLFYRSTFWNGTMLFQAFPCERNP